MLFNVAIFHFLINTTWCAQVINTSYNTPPLDAMTGHPKIMIVAYPGGQGHINPALRFANRILKIGVKVTFCTSFSGIQGINKQTTSPHGLTFVPFSDGQDNVKQPSSSMQQFISDVATNGSCVVTEIISSAAAAGEPFDNLVYTPLVPWAITVANAHNVKSTLLWCQLAATLDIYYYYFNGYDGYISGNNNNPTFPINLPGLPPLTVADLPSFFSSSRPKEHDCILRVVKDHIDGLKTSPRVLVNTFDELEIESLRAIDKLELLSIGPLIPSEFLDGKGEDSLDGCIEWLNTKDKSSVVYVSFGTVANFSMDQMEEIAVGLVEGGRPFIWVIRDSELARTLSKTKELQKQGMIVDWCSQVAVLSHRAIGCFVMHGGWNSTLEALATGVPLVVFPQWSDQATNAKMIEDVWKTGVMVKKREVDGVVEGNEIKRCVEIVISGNDSGEIRRNAEKWRDLAREAFSNGGSSTLNLQVFLDYTI